MLSKTTKVLLAATVIVATFAATFDTAEAQNRRRRGGGNAGAAIAAGVALGVIGLGAAAIAEQRRRDREEVYYGRPRYVQPSPRYYDEERSPAYYAPRYYNQDRAPAYYAPRVDPRTGGPPGYYAAPDGTWQPVPRVRRAPASNIYIDPYTGRETRILQ